MTEVTQEVIAGWKAKYGHVYKTAEGIYFRPLTRNEYVKLITDQQKDPEKYDYEMAVSNLCVLAGIGDNDLDVKSGLATALCEQILLRSGFGVEFDVEEL